MQRFGELSFDGVARKGTDGQYAVVALVGRDALEEVVKGRPEHLGSTESFFCLDFDLGAVGKLKPNVVPGASGFERHRSRGRC